MPTARDRNSFGNAFLQAFNAVDSARHRRDRNALLEDQLEEAKKDRAASRKRTAQFDRERAEDRAIAKQDRGERLHQVERSREATALMADVDVPSDVLQPYADIPQVAAFLAARDEDANLQAASRTFHDEINANAQPGVAPGQQATQQPGNQFTENVVGAAELPSPSGGQVTPIVSEAEINRIADEQGVEAAAPFREARAQEMAKKEASLAAGPAGTHSAQSFRGGVSAPSLPDEEAIAAKQARTDTVGQWESFGDLNDETGEGLRQLDSNILTAKYFDDRSTVMAENPQVTDRLDKRMAPHLAKTVETQSRILAAADPSTPEARNARRKLSEAYGLQQEIFGTYQPLRSSGVDARGLTTNGTNEALTSAAIEQGQATPGAPYPDNPNRTRADLTIVQRGTKGRVSEKLAQSAWRLMKGGLIDNKTYDHVMRTGRLPAAVPIIKDHDPKKDLLAHYPNGTVVNLMPARDPEAELNALRNTIGGDALKQLNLIAGALDDESDDARGTKSLASLNAAIAGNENFLRARGYDMNNINDAMLVYQRFVDMTYLRDAYNDEWRLNGRWNPDFKQDYGTLLEALFDPRIDDINRDELETPGSTFLGMGGESPDLVGLKPRNPAEIQAVMQAGFASTPEEAEALIAEREAAGDL